MPLLDLLKKKDRVPHEEKPAPPSLPQASEFTFLRTTTHTQELIKLPTFEDVPLPPTPKRTVGRYRKPGDTSRSPSPSGKEHKRLSERLHLGSKSRGSSTSSVNLPTDLPAIHDAYSAKGDKQEQEAQWEERATILAQENPSASGLVEKMDQTNLSSSKDDEEARSGRPRSVSDATGDVTIQEAIQQHEAGNLVEATKMFKTLAESGNVLSQVLYGLSLRHGWGCDADPKRAVRYLSAAASNSATIEKQALAAGMKKGGAAKGELVLAIFELANCFRHGWGVPVDKVAARHYYETAANLGDTDAMNEAAWCYLEGFGGKKDKVSHFTSIHILSVIPGPTLLVNRVIASLPGRECHKAPSIRPSLARHGRFWSPIQDRPPVRIGPLAARPW